MEKNPKIYIHTYIQMCIIVNKMRFRFFFSFLLYSRRRWCGAAPMNSGVRIWHVHIRRLFVCMCVLFLWIPFSLYIYNVCADEYLGCKPHVAVYMLLITHFTKGSICVRIRLKTEEIISFIFCAFAIYEMLIVVSVCGMCVFWYLPFTMRVYIQHAQEYMLNLLNMLWQEMMDFGWFFFSSFACAIWQSVVIGLYEHDA